MYNIAEKLTRVADTEPEKIGCIEVKSGYRFTFKDLEVRSNAYASFFLSQGIRPGQRVMLMVAPSADFICLSFALFRLGAPVILIDPGMGYRNVLRCVEGVKPDYFIGIPKAIVFRSLFRKPFATIKKSFCCGSLLALPGTDFRKRCHPAAATPPLFQPTKDALAAIIFTTGSTGPPKGVRFEHSIFSAQLDYIKSYYGIDSKDIDQPGFPLFGLFSIALGACTVIPDMDPTKPAQVDPAKFMDSLITHQVTYSFGSPAIWNEVSRFCAANQIRSNHLKKVLMAGAPVPGDLIERVYNLMENDGKIFTPYGATECLPVVSIEGREIVSQTWQMTLNGKGTCVGRPLPEIEVKIIEPDDSPLASLADCTELPAFTPGEIMVKGAVVTKSYENNEYETRMSKVSDQEGFWHRIGDIGYLDDSGRLWFCGRKAHRVYLGSRIMDTIPTEAIINQHPAVFRSALVGIEHPSGEQLPVIVVELQKNAEIDQDKLFVELKEIARNHPNTSPVNHFLIHPSFPVDIRHNAKIFREKLKGWAESELRGKT